MSGCSIDITDEQWEFLLPYLMLMIEAAPQRMDPLKVLFNTTRYVVHTRLQWRYLAKDFPPWTAVDQQARRWIWESVFELIACDLRIIERVLQDRE